MTDWPYMLKKAIKLLRVDVRDITRKIPKEDIVIIRGKKDNFFCDEEAVKIIKEDNIALIEVEAGHDWNDKIAETVNSLVRG